MMTSCLHEIVRRVVSHCFQSQCGTHVSSKSESYKCKSATTMSLNQHREDNKKKDNTCCVAQFYTVLLRNMYVNHEDIHWGLLRFRLISRAIDPLMFEELTNVMCCVASFTDPMRSPPRLRNQSGCIALGRQEGLFGRCKAWKGSHPVYLFVHNLWFTASHTNPNDQARWLLPSDSLEPSFVVQLLCLTLNVQCH